MIPSIVFSTYQGGTSSDLAESVALDRTGSAIFVTGLTGSANFPTVNPYQSLNAGVDAFITKWAADGAVSWSSYLGGTGEDFATDIAVDSTGKPVITGGTKSFNFPTTIDALQPVLNSTEGVADAYVARFSGDGTALDYSTYLGGTGSDNKASIDGAIALDSSDNIIWA